MFLTMGNRLEDNINEVYDSREPWAYICGELHYRYVWNNIRNRLHDFKKAVAERELVENDMERAIELERRVRRRLAAYNAS